jgi:hypothetical protein
MTRGPTLHALFGRRPPVDLLLHPMTLAALAVMVLNDGWLRGAHPGWLTGKVSDFAAVLAYPGLLTALWGLGTMALDGLVTRASVRANSPQTPGRGVDYSLRPMVVLGACLFTGSLLVGINLWTPFRDGYLSALRLLDLFGWFGPFHYTMDPSDLLALVLLPVVWLVGHRLLARVPAGRLRAVHRKAMRQAVRGTGDATRDAVRTAVAGGLADVRRASGPDGNATLNVLQDLLVEGALQEAMPPDRREANIAFDPTKHYHRVLQALETHRNRGSNP